MCVTSTKSRNGRVNCGARFRLPRRFSQEKFELASAGAGDSVRGASLKATKSAFRTLPCATQKKPRRRRYRGFEVGQNAGARRGVQDRARKRSPGDGPGLPLWGRLEWQETVLPSPNAPAARGVPARHKSSARVFRLKRPGRNDKRTLVRFSPPLVRFSPRPLLLYAAGVQA